MDQDFIERLEARLEPALRQRDGIARLAEWHCEDGQVVRYTTSRVQGGPHDGRFLAQLFAPEADGLEYVEASRREFATRKAAKAQALRWYRKHSPKWSRRHPPEAPQ